VGVGFFFSSPLCVSFFRRTRRRSRSRISFLLASSNFFF